MPPPQRAPLRHLHLHLEEPVGGVRRTFPFHPIRQVRLAPHDATFVFRFGFILAKFHIKRHTLLRTCPPSRITPLRRTCWGPFGLAQLLGWERRSRGDRPTVFRGSALCLGIGHAGRVTLPLVSGRWRTQGAARRYSFHSLFFLVPFAFTPYDLRLV